MKHCRNCEYCRMDMVAQYVKGLDLYKCDKTNMVIKEPFWEGRDCGAYKKNSWLNAKKWLKNGNNQSN